VSGFVKEDEVEFVRLVQERSDLQSAETAKVQQKQLAKHQKRHKDLDSLIKQLFESKAEGSLSAKRFEILSGEYEREQEDLERQIAGLQAGLEVYDAESGNTERFMQMVRRYTGIPELTPTILNEYIEKIVVFEADKSSGRREQTVNFYFNFIGNIAIPIPEELEPEPFDPVKHRKAIQRASYYKHRDKILAKKAEQRAEEKAVKLAQQPVKTPEELAAEEEAKKERKRAYQRNYQREWQKKKREEKLAGSADCRNNNQVSDSRIAI
jgi:hypothetical protein